MKPSHFFFFALLFLCCGWFIGIQTALTIIDRNFEIIPVAPDGSPLFVAPNGYARNLSVAPHGYARNIHLAQHTQSESFILHPSSLNTDTIAIPCDKLCDPTCDLLAPISPQLLGGQRGDQAQGKLFLVIWQYPEIAIKEGTFNIQVKDTLRYAGQKRGISYWTRN